MFCPGKSFNSFLKLIKLSYYFDSSILESNGSTVYFNCVCAYSLLYMAVVNSVPILYLIIYLYFPALHMVLLTNILITSDVFFRDLKLE